MKIVKIVPVKESKGGGFNIIMSNGDEYGAYDTDGNGMEIPCNISPEIESSQLMDAGKRLESFAYLIFELEKAFPEHGYDKWAEADDGEWCMSLTIPLKEWDEIYKKYKL